MKKLETINDLKMKRHYTLDGVRVAFEPGDMTHYDLVVVSSSGGANAVLVMLSPERRVMQLPPHWRKELSEFYVMEKLDVNEYTARVVVDALHTGVFD